MDELIQFKATPEMKAILEKWAKDDDRTLAYIVRKIINEEIARRTATIPQVKINYREPVNA